MSQDKDRYENNKERYQAENLFGHKLMSCTGSSWQQTQVWKGHERDTNYVRYYMT